MFKVSLVAHRTVEQTKQLPDIYRIRDYCDRQHYTILFFFSDHLVVVKYLSSADTKPTVKHPACWTKNLGWIQYFRHHQQCYDDLMTLIW